MFAGLFVGMFALDAIHEGFVAFLMHALPAIVLLLIVALSWRWEWIGGVLFVALAVLYGVMASWRPDWVLVISGPLFLVGVLFLWSWRHHAELHAGN